MFHRYTRFSAKPAFKILFATAILFTCAHTSFAQTPGNNTDGALYISSDGNVGIGRETPEARLDVKGNVKVEGGLSLTNNLRVSGKIDGNLQLGKDQKIWWDYADRCIDVVNNVDATSVIMRFRNTMNKQQGNEFGGFDFTDATSNSILRIVDYKVGIGNNKPNAKLDVGGNIKATGEIKTDDRVKDKTGYVTPKGGIIMYAGSKDNFDGSGIGKAGTDVEGWALCDGGGNPQRPDLRDRFVVGAGRDYTVGNTGGEAKHTLSEDEMPAHSHANGVGGGQGHERQNEGWGNSSGYACNSCAFTVWSKKSGGNKPHENRPPYYAVLYIMKL